MKSLLPPANFVFGAFFGMACMLFIFGMTSYQSGHCSQANQPAQTDPSRENPIGAIQSEDQKREAEITEDARRDPSICGVAGTIRFSVGYMDHHEGFFVGLFTFALVLVTGLLWQSTNRLWIAGERQLEHIESNAKAAVKSADAALVSNRAWLKLDLLTHDVHAIIVDNRLQASFNLRTTNVGKIPATNIRILIAPFVDSFRNSDFNAWAAQRGEEVRRFEVLPGQFLFPGEVEPPMGSTRRRGMIGVPLDLVRESEAFGSRFGGRGFILRVLISATYLSPPSKEVHLTRKLFTIEGTRGGLISLQDLEAAGSIGVMLTANNLFGPGDHAD